ncbi:MAG: T9SS type A sorting domain-containing protein [Bacteroidetes bacterium]|nr:T9SS type A sorting domain-containing protein [Bacteroidota bacterium]
MRKALNISILILVFSNQIIAQGFYNHVWLLGNYFFIQDPKGRMVFDSTSYTHSVEFRKMPFLGTEATICDAQGNFLMSSNGIWIANANNDTMVNGGDLAPGFLTSSWPYGIPLGYGALFLPFPGDSIKYVLFHKSRQGQFAIDPTILYSSTIDISLDGGLGSVVLKNDSIFADTLSWGISACKHANGRDWWIVCIKDGNPQSYTFLLTPFGIDTMLIQNFGLSTNTYGNVSQLMFSQDGSKFIYSSPMNQSPSGNLIIADFDRCTGFFSNINSLSVSPASYLFGLAFSPNSDYAYTCSSSKIYQIDTDSLTVDTVASYDGFISPPGQTCCATSFFNMYLAANAKIYITSGSSVQHLHEMNYPDSAGIACDVQQHAIDLGSYLHLRAVPNHPNYNLGRVVGSICDSLVGIEELEHDFKFGISPNPTNDGYIKLVYLLPQNKNGVFEVYNVIGQRVFEINLPAWSTLQFVKIPEMSNGVYTCVIRSGYERVGKKLVVMR